MLSLDIVAALIFYAFLDTADLKCYNVSVLTISMLTVSIVTKRGIYIE